MNNTMKKYYIYKHTNKVNGKSYIGVTSMEPKDRWRNGYGYRSQPKFFNAIMKNGWNNFSHEIIAACYSKEIAYEIEKALIKKYDSIDNGYNVSEGGNGMDCAFERFAVDKYNPITGELICTYNSISDAAKDVGASDSHISECCNGKHKTAAGFGWTYHGKTYVPPDSFFRYTCIEKVDVNTGQVVETYNSQKEAAEKNGVSSSLINICCRGKQKIGIGYIWRYKT